MEPQGDMANPVMVGLPIEMPPGTAGARANDIMLHWSDIFECIPDSIAPQRDVAMQEVDDGNDEKVYVARLRRDRNIPTLTTPKFPTSQEHCQVCGACKRRSLNCSVCLLTCRNVCLSALLTEDLEVYVAKIPVYASAGRPAFWS